MSDTSQFIRINNRGINFTQVEDFSFCPKQVTLTMISGNQIILTDKEEVAAFGLYISGIMPNIVDAMTRQRILHVNDVARRKMYAEADMLHKRLDPGPEVNITPGPGFGGHDNNPNLTTGDPHPPRPNFHPGTPRKGSSCCGKGGKTT